jgi:branched-chain amino acid transport system substrate-binding protein
MLLFYGRQIKASLCVVFSMQIKGAIVKKSLNQWRRAIVFLAATTAFCSPFAYAQNGVKDKEIIIGQSIGLQGGNDAFAVAVNQGVKLYLDSVNAAGGVYGRKITVKVLDDEGKGPLAEANANKLAEEGVFIFFGSIGGGPSTAVMKVANAKQIPLFGPMAGSPILRRPHQEMVFPVRAEHRDEFRKLLKTARDMGLGNVGFMHGDNEIGKMHLENVTIAAKDLGQRVLLPVAVKSDITDAQIDEVVASMETNKINIMLHNVSGKIFVKLVQKAKAKGLKTTFMGVNQESFEIAKMLGEDSKGITFAQVVPSPWQRKIALAREYQDMASKAKITFNYGSLEGYMTAKALVAALRANGKTLTRASLIKTLESNSFDLGGLIVKYAPGDHEGSKFVDLSLRSREGQFVH